MNAKFLRILEPVDFTGRKFVRFSSAWPISHYATECVISIEGVEIRVMCDTSPMEFKNVVYDTLRASVMRKCAAEAMRILSRRLFEEHGVFI